MSIRFGDKGTYLIGTARLNNEARNIVNSLFALHQAQGDHVQSGPYWVAIRGVTPGEGYSLREAVWQDDSQSPFLYIPDRPQSPVTVFKVNQVVHQLGQIVDTMA